MSVTAYPLAWPPGWPRTKPEHREDSRYRFKTASGPVSFEKARSQLAEELDLLRAFHIVLSTNIPLRLDGQPRSDAARTRMEDPGVAVYFTLHNRPMVMAQDRYTPRAPMSARSAWRSRPCASSSATAAAR